MRVRVLVGGLVTGSCALLLSLGASAATGPQLRSCGATLPVVSVPVWPAALRTLVPSGPVEMDLCGANRGGRVTSDLAAAGPVASELAAEFDAIPAATVAAPGSCREPTIRRVLARFGYGSGQTVAVSAELGGCALVSNGAVSRRATGRYGHLLRDLELLTGVAPPLLPRLIDTRGAPRCSSTAARAPALSGIPTAEVAVPGAPFGLASTRDGRWSFAALDGVVSPSSAEGRRWWVGSPSCQTLP